MLIARMGDAKTSNVWEASAFYQDQFFTSKSAKLELRERPAVVKWIPDFVDGGNPFGEFWGHPVQSRLVLTVFSIGGGKGADR